MISTVPWREHLGDGTIVVDITGAPLRVEGLPENVVVPALVVGRVSEAVKEVDGEMVVANLNRDTMWSVEGFVLSEEVASILPEELESAASLIEAVTGAGLAWSVVLPASPPETE
jgi:phosphosulfolactate phosphohydrolase-like enzyme